MVKKMGNTFLGAFVGFMVIAALAYLFPGIGHILGGFIGGFIAGVVAKSMIKGAIAGFIAGSLGAILFAILAFFGTIFADGVNFGILEALFAGFKGLAVGLIVLILGAIGAIISAIAGFIGGALTK